MQRDAVLSAHAPAAGLAAADEAMAERQLAILGRLAEAGLEIALALEAQAKGGEVVVEGDIAMAYSRVARAVRQTVMLQSKLIAERRERLGLQADRKAAAKASASRLLRGVIDEDRGRDRDSAERLAAEAAERLREEDFGDLLSRPFAEVVAGICRDLGLSPDWLELAEDCFAAEAAFTGKGVAAPDEPPSGRVEVCWIGEEPDRRRDSS